MAIVSRPTSFSGRCAGTCSSRSATATSNGCSPTAASWSITSACFAGCNASRSSWIKRTRRHLRRCRGPWHVDETYLRVDGQWRYLYRAVDGTGRTIDFMLSAKRDKAAARRFFGRALLRENTRNPRTIVTDRLKSYPGAIREMRRGGGALALCSASARAMAQQLDRAGSSLHQAPNPADAQFLGFLDRTTHLGRHRNHGDFGQRTGARRVPANAISARRTFVHQVFDLAA
ncbi:DDE-type integrase/transposase/recombinase [Marinivivus vitaminiproducens]|nr:DDE-type integrase/transposase/recombinase [Geminicoccaceae bacterium SCSIO 64248]